MFSDAPLSLVRLLCRCQVLTIFSVSHLSHACNKANYSSKDRTDERRSVAYGFERYLVGSCISVLGCRFLPFYLGKLLHISHVSVQAPDENILWIKIHNEMSLIFEQFVCLRIRGKDKSVEM